MSIMYVSVEKRALLKIVFFKIRSFKKLMIQATMTEAGAKLYPYCDYNVWLRTCEKEVTEPLEGNITGTIPSWVSGTLLRNGPGATHVGDSQFKHLFDGSALLHRFAIKDGRATYQCRFVRSNTYKKNRAANRILFTEFGTAAVPDPCQTMFERFASAFRIGETLTDNTMVSVYPFGDEVYSLTEVPIIHRIDPVTLKTMERKVLDAYVVNHTAHPHVMPNGDVYNLGMARSKGKLNHVIVKFPYTEKGDMFEKAHLVCTVPPRWSIYPSYMHSFGITENYFVLIEQSLCLSLFSFLKNQIRKQPIATSLQFYPEEETCIILVDRRDLSVKRYRTDTFTFFHMINCYEENRKMVVDLCVYKDAKLIEALYVEKVEAMQSTKDFASWTRSRAKRIEIPLDAPEMTKAKIKLLADIGFETPKIHYEKFNGRPYRYCYGANYDADVKHSQPIVKIDCKTGDILTWCDDGWSPGEPIFVAHPDAKEEDAGVLLSAMVRECAPNSSSAHDIALIVLGARDLREVARVTFRTPTPAPKSLHGWFLPDNN